MLSSRPQAPLDCGRPHNGLPCSKESPLIFSKKAVNVGFNTLAYELFDPASSKTQKAVTKRSILSIGSMYCKARS
jgi:hypothetical protein